MYSLHKEQMNDIEVTIIDITQTDIKVSLMNYGASILHIFTKDHVGLEEDIVIAYQDINDYNANNRHLNATIGPTAGRILHGEFTIDEQTTNLNKNFQDKHNLHGGFDALSYTMFDYEISEEEFQTEVLFRTRRSKGTHQYPGNQQYQIIYTIKDGSVIIEFLAETDHPTLVNLTNHTYFNLSGNLRSTIENHLMQINAKNGLKLDHEMIPIGVISFVDTPLDYRSLQPIKGPNFTGVDDPYIVDHQTIDIAQATLIDPISKRRLDVFTTYPCVVCYTDNFPMHINLAYGAKNVPHMGVCFEAQNPPNGIYLEGMESSILRPKERYYHKTIFQFSVVK